MSDQLFLIVSTYGVGLIAVSAFLSCLFLPVPTSLIMLAGGAFIATGDLTAWHVIAAAFCGAVLGDQTGFQLGRAGETMLVKLTHDRPKRQILLEKAQKMVEKRGFWGVFFSTWLFAPLGPWVNVVAGATGLRWLTFTIADILGEAIWVSVYVGLGYGFSTRLSDVATILGNSLGFLTAGILTLGLGLALRHQIRAIRIKSKDSDPQPTTLP